MIVKALSNGMNFIPSYFVFIVYVHLFLLIDLKHEELIRCHLFTRSFKRHQKLQLFLMIPLICLILLPM